MSVNRMCLGLCVIGLVLSGGARAELAVIANPAFPVDSTDADAVKRLYLGKKSPLKRAGAGAIDQASGTEARAQFLNSVLDKNESQLKSYWSRRIFSGKGRPPQKLGNDAAVKSEVASNANIIGYIDASQVDDSVKVLLTIQ